MTMIFFSGGMLAITCLTKGRTSEILGGITLYAIIETVFGPGMSVGHLLVGLLAMAVARFAYAYGKDLAKEESK